MAEINAPTADAATGPTLHPATTHQPSTAIDWGEGDGDGAIADDDESWRSQFDASCRASRHSKLWKQERLVRQEEKRAISNYLRSIDRDARFVAKFASQPRCVCAHLCRGVSFVAPAVVCGGRSR